MFFSSDAQKIFIDTDTLPVTTEEPLDIVLSPAFYWVKRVHLPVKRLGDVRKLLPSLFEEILPEGSYSYRAVEEGDDYLIFAYDDRKIIDALGRKNITAGQIRHLYFAQSECEQTDEPIRAGDEHVMLFKEGVLVRLPKRLAAEATPLRLKEQSSSADRVVLARYTNIADTRSVGWTVGLTGLLIVLFALEWLMVGSKNTQIEAKQQALFEQYDLKPTKLQNEAVLNRLETLYGKQAKIRDVAGSLLRTQLQGDERVTDLSIGQEKAVVLFEKIDQKRARQLEAELRQSGLQPVTGFEKGMWKVEVAL